MKAGFLAFVMAMTGSATVHWLNPVERTSTTATLRCDDRYVIPRYTVYVEHRHYDPGLPDLPWYRWSYETLEFK